MDGLFEHCMPGEFFHAHMRRLESPLLVRPTEWIAERFRLLPPEKQRAVRCLIGTHVAMDVDRIFDRPAKFFTIIRQPVDRVVSHFYHVKTEQHVPVHPYIKDMTLEQYLDSGMALDTDNLQVRILSGAPELDGRWDPDGGPVVAATVEPHHLEMAKRNIEDRFIVAAPLEQFTALVWFFKRLYQWPTHRVCFMVRNDNAGYKQNEREGRPPLTALSPATRQRLEHCNRYDMELHAWVTARFAEQIRPMEPHFSRQVHRFALINGGVQRVALRSPPYLRRLAGRVLFLHSAARSASAERLR